MSVCAHMHACAARAAVAKGGLRRAAGAATHIDAAHGVIDDGILMLRRGGAVPRLRARQPCRIVVRRLPHHIGQQAYTPAGHADIALEADCEAAIDAALDLDHARPRQHRIRQREVRQRQQRRARTFEHQLVNKLRRRRRAGDARTREHHATQGVLPLLLGRGRYQRQRLRAAAPLSAAAATAAAAFIGARNGSAAAAAAAAAAGEAIGRSGAAAATARLACGADLCARGEHHSTALRHPHLPGGRTRGR